MAFGNVQGQSWISKNELDGYVPKSGATMTGPLILADAPTSSLMAANKGYVDEVQQNASKVFTKVFAGAREGDDKRTYTLNFDFIPKVFGVTLQRHNSTDSCSGVFAFWSQGADFFCISTVSSRKNTTVLVSGTTLTINGSAPSIANSIGYTYYYFALG